MEKAVAAAHKTAISTALQKHIQLQQEHQLQQRRLEEHMLMQRQLKMSLEVHEQYLQTLLATGIVEPGEKEKGSGASAGAGGSGGEPRRRGV